jgi:hypothetical protein
MPSLWALETWLFVRTEKPSKLPAIVRAQFPPVAYGVSSARLKSSEAMMVPCALASAAVKSTPSVIAALRIVEPRRPVMKRSPARSLDDHGPYANRRPQGRRKVEHTVAVSPAEGRAVPSLRATVRRRHQAVRSAMRRVTNLAKRQSSARPRRPDPAESRSCQRGAGAVITAGPIETVSSRAPGSTLSRTRCRTTPPRVTSQ